MKKMEEEKIRDPPLSQSVETYNSSIGTKEEIYMNYKKYLNFKTHKKMHKIMKVLETYCFCGILKD